MHECSNDVGGMSELSDARNKHPDKEVNWHRLFYVQSCEKVRNLA